jgi:hypothetical protein
VASIGHINSVLTLPPYGRSKGAWVRVAMCGSSELRHAAAAPRNLPIYSSESSKLHRFGSRFEVVFATGLKRPKVRQCCHARVVEFHKVFWAKTLRSWLRGQHIMPCMSRYVTVCHGVPMSGKGRRGSVSRPWGRFPVPTLSQRISDAKLSTGCARLVRLISQTPCNSSIRWSDVNSRHSSIVRPTTSSESAV